MLHGREHRKRFGQPVPHLIARALDPATRGVVDGRVRREDRVEARPVQGVHSSRVGRDEIVDLDAVGNGLRIQHGPTLVPNMEHVLAPYAFRRRRWRMREAPAPRPSAHPYCQMTVSGGAPSGRLSRGAW
jgi:hypothetical protein